MSWKKSRSSCPMYFSIFSTRTTLLSLKIPTKLFSIAGPNDRFSIFRVPFHKSAAIIYIRKENELMRAEKRLVPGAEKSPLLTRKN